MNYADEKQIFISYSSLDKELVSPFQSLILEQGIGVEHRKIFCTLRDSTGIEIGENFINIIKETLGSIKIFIPLISVNYLRSSICLLELGGAWCTGLKICPILIPPLEYRDIEKLYIIRNSIAKKIDDQYGLSNLKATIESILSINPSIETLRWMEVLNEFQTLIQPILKQRRESDYQGNDFYFIAKDSSDTINRFFMRLVKEDLIEGYLHTEDVSNKNYYEIYLNSSIDIDKIYSIAKEERLVSFELIGLNKKIQKDVIYG